MSDTREIDDLLDGHAWMLQQGIAPQFGPRAINALVGEIRALRAVVEAAVVWRSTDQPDTETHLQLVYAVDALQAHREARNG